MSQAFADYQKFKAGASLAKTQLDRAQLLYSHGAAPQKDLEVAEDTLNRANIDTQAAEERIRLLGGDPQHPSALIEIHAPVSGTIIEQNVTSAAGVKSLDNSPNLFTIADLSNVWILCDVYENDLARVHMGDRAEIELNAYPDRRLAGRVTNISKLLDPNTRAAKVRIELSNAAGMLRPNMFATVHFVSQGTLNAYGGSFERGVAAAGPRLGFRQAERPEVPQDRSASRAGERRQDAADTERLASGRPGGD